MSEFRGSNPDILFERIAVLDTTRRVLSQPTATIPTEVDLLELVSNRVLAFKGLLPAFGFDTEVEFSDNGIKYRLDFFYRQYAIAIEVDDPSHRYKIDEDNARDVWFGKRGVRTYRFTHEAIERDMKRCLRDVYELLDAVRATS